jgi:AcrR family transcriptional regulator
MVAPGRGRWERYLSREARADSQRRRILGALPGLIAELGNAFTVDDVVEAAGIGRNTFYVHFEGTDAAVETLLAEVLEELTRALSEVDAASRTPLARVRGIAAVWARCSARRPALSLLAHAGAEDDGVNGALRAHLTDALRGARRAGIVGREPDALRVELLIGAFDAAAVQLAEDPGSEGRVADALVDLVLRGLR